MKNKKGITLIALIITIIVMLILVAVTINVALNGGLFGKAKDAKVKTQKEVEREQLLEAVVSAYNNQGSFAIGSVDMPDDMEWVESKETAYTGSSTTTPSNDGGWVATKNENYFYIDSYGNILDKEPEKPTYKVYSIEEEDGVILYWIMGSDNSLYMGAEGEVAKIIDKDRITLKKRTIQDIEALFNSNYIEDNEVKFDKTTENLFIFQIEGGGDNPMFIYNESNDIWYALEYNSTSENGGPRTYTDWSIDKTKTMTRSNKDAEDIYINKIEQR